ncbi:nucleoside 2-deoxyribosyltransferase [Marinomonas sp. THO17]|uniref:nucleoside 2-deoxyribosyltransferase n=1 Tax=Marinomonas sp. THO17 TaxID=3149048 RepID=UPI00336BB3F3
MKTIYLAGPEVFLANPKEIGEAKKALCKKYGFIGLFPLDKDIKAQPSRFETAMAISQGNEALIMRSDIVVANLTPFRGPSADAGTIYELGMGRALNLMIAGYSNCQTPYFDRVWQVYGQGEQLSTDSREIRDSDGNSIENFGLMDNLMLEGGIQASSQVFVTQQVEATQRFTDLTAFEAVLKQLQDL